MQINRQGGQQFNYRFKSLPCTQGVYRIKADADRLLLILSIIAAKSLAFIRS